MPNRVAEPDEVPGMQFTCSEKAGREIEEHENIKYKRFLIFVLVRTFGQVSSVDILLHSAS